MFEPHHVSRYFDKRRNKSRLEARKKHRKFRANRRIARIVKRLPKLSLAVHAATHLILAARATTGLGIDHPQFVPLLRRAASRMSLGLVVADAGFDSEFNHRAARQELQVRSLIPATIGQPGTRPPSGYYRRLMRQRMKNERDLRHYRQRWQVETVNSMVKRNLGSACRSRGAWGRKRDLLLRAITHNLMIIENL